MRVFQGTISSEYNCRPLMESNRPIGLLFYKTNNTTNLITGFALVLGLLLSVFFGFKFNFIAFLITASFSVGLFIFFSISDRGNNEADGIKYPISQISEVKILDNDTIASYAKSGSSSLAGAAVGGVLFGGAGAIVGSIASGNTQLKEQTVRVGVKFADANWVVLESKIDATTMGKVNASNLKIFLEMTASKQAAPF